jgi:hypothetical protein
MRLAIVMVAVAALTVPALAHSWYDAACCDVSDCRPIDGVEEHPDGYHYRGVVIPFTKARQSLDGGLSRLLRRWRREASLRR